LAHIEILKHCKDQTIVVALPVQPIIISPVPK